MHSITDNTLEHRLEIREDGHLAYLDYRMRGDAVEYLHTETPEELKGRGLASELAKFALDRDLASGRKVIATCPFVKTYIKRHPEYGPLVGP